MPKTEKPRIETLEADLAAQDWDRVLDEVRRERARVILETDGTPVAALISKLDLERLVRWEAEEHRRLEILRHFREPFRGVPSDEIEREVSKAIAEVRAEAPDEGA